MRKTPEKKAQRRRKVSRRANIRGQRPNPCERGKLTFHASKEMPGLSPARQQKRHAFKLTYVSEITLVISNQCGLFGVLGAKPLGEWVVSNEVRARERLLPFQASKEVPDWIRHDRGRRISSCILRDSFITKILQNYHKTLTSKKTQLGSL